MPLLALGDAYTAIGFRCACGYAALGGRLRALGLGGHTHRTLEALTGAATSALGGGLTTEHR